MILVNQGIRTSVAEKLEKGGHMMFHIKETCEWGWEGGEGG